jgi:hypothetical protein
MFQWRKLKSTFVASVVSILVTLLATVLAWTSRSGNNRYAVPALYIFIIAGLLLLGLVHLRAYIADLTDVRKELKNYEVMSRCVPTLVTFKSREDTLLVESTGDGWLTWDFHLEAAVPDHASELTFPVYVELEAAKMPPEPIRVERLEVNGRRRPTADVYKRIERRQPQDRPRAEEMLIEYGLLRVPVELEPGNRSCHVQVTTKLIGAYSHLFQSDPLFIEIPYITEKLRVKIYSRGLTVRRISPELGGPWVIAMSSQMHTFDPEDSSRQSRLCVERAGELLWETDSPKLGYQYKVHFRVEQE